MHRFIFLFLLSFTISFFTQKEVLSDEIAITQDGRQVLLKDNKTWEYLVEEGNRNEVIKVDLDVKRALKPLIMRRDRAFQESFDLEIDWNSNNPFELVYRSIMEGLYYAATRQSKIDFTKKAEKAFGSKTSKNLVYLIENWTLWRDVVSQ
ncbi:MAG: hypothetical protein ABH848_00645 [Candidatus Omnitrophota bacterium]